MVLEQALGMVLTRLMESKAERWALPEVMTLEQAAQFLQVSESWLEKQVAAGLAPALRYGRTVRFTREDLLAWGKKETG
jgi:excisionase family DNA binding protein